MEVIRTVMLNIIVIVFFTTILDLILPETTFRSYIKMAMGFFVVLTILQPIATLLRHDTQAAMLQQMMHQAEYAADLPAAGSGNPEYNTIYETYYMSQMEQQYAMQTARQIQALLNLADYDVEQVECSYILTEGTDRKEEKQLMVLVYMTNCTASEQENIQESISGYFGLSAAQVQIVGGE